MGYTNELNKTAQEVLGGLLRSGLATQPEVALLGQQYQRDTYALDNRLEQQYPNEITRDIIVNFLNQYFQENLSTVRRMTQQPMGMGQWGMQNPQQPQQQWGGGGFQQPQFGHGMLGNPQANMMGGFGNQPIRGMGGQSWASPNDEWVAKSNVQEQPRPVAPGHQEEPEQELELFNVEPFKGVSILKEDKIPVKGIDLTLVTYGPKDTPVTGIKLNMVDKVYDSPNAIMDIISRVVDAQCDPDTPYFAVVNYTTNTPYCSKTVTMEDVVKAFATIRKQLLDDVTAETATAVTYDQVEFGSLDLIKSILDQMPKGVAKIVEQILVDRFNTYVHSGYLVSAERCKIKLGVDSLDECSEIYSHGYIPGIDKLYTDDESAKREFRDNLDRIGIEAFFKYTCDIKLTKLGSGTPVDNVVAHLVKQRHIGDRKSKMSTQLNLFNVVSSERLILTSLPPYEWSTDDKPFAIITPMNMCDWLLTEHVSAHPATLYIANQIAYVGVSTNQKLIITKS